jgi:hypothetical protein
MLQRAFRQGRPRVQGLTIEQYRTGAHELDALRCEVLFKPDGQTLATPDHPSVGVDVDVFFACDELSALRSARRCPLGWKNGGAHLVGVERPHDHRSGLRPCQDGRLAAAERPVARNDPNRRHREGTNNHRPPPAGGDRLGRWDALVLGRLDRRAVDAVIRRMPLTVGSWGDLSGSRRFLESVQRCPALGQTADSVSPVQSHRTQTRSIRTASSASHAGTDRRSPAESRPRVRRAARGQVRPTKSADLHPVTRRHCQRHEADLTWPILIRSTYKER